MLSLVIKYKISDKLFINVKRTGAETAKCEKQTNFFATFSYARLPAAPIVVLTYAMI